MKAFFIAISIILAVDFFGLCFTEHYGRNQSVFDKYKQAFSNDVLKKISKPLSKIPIAFTYENGLKHGTIALCTYGVTPPKILIDPISWERFSESTKEAVIFHELSHCELRLRHNNCTIKSVPISLMFPIIENFSEQYSTNKKFYISRLIKEYKYQESQL